MSKRALDILLSSLFLLLAFPVLLIAAGLIKLGSEGPVLFRQWRMGRGFREFRLLKLRTMRTAAGGSAYTLGADPRITRVGFWLRWFKVDELPQLWNVLRGEMSIVGPRPVIPELAHEFHEEYRHLLCVRPGLTDPATLRYCREVAILSQVPEPLEYFKSTIVPEKLRISLDYLRHATVWSDLGVMASTACALFLLLWKQPAKELMHGSHGEMAAPTHRLTGSWGENVPAFAGFLAVCGESRGVFRRVESERREYRHFRDPARRDKDERHTWL